MSDNIFAFAQPVSYYKISVDRLEFLVTIILGDDSLKKTFSHQRTRCHKLCFFS